MDAYTDLIRPVLFRKQAEDAHELTLHGLAVAARIPGVLALAREHFAVLDPRLAVTLWGQQFANPIGLAAGMDKEAAAIPGFAALGFSHVEVGTVTGQGQPGNPRPRLFRLPSDRAVINRMGFNNTGAVAVAQRLASQYDVVGGLRRPACRLGINLGKTKLVPNEAAADDYAASVRALGRFADYVVVNVSSPNTPGLRDLQSEASLRPLLRAVRAELDVVAPGTPLLLKIAPDLADAGLDAAVDVALETQCNGLIATNTTIARTGLSASAERLSGIGAGGLSGAPLRLRADAVLAHIARRVAGRVPLIGVGGVDGPAAAWRKMCLGASLVQVYSAIIYHGPSLVQEINQGLSTYLDQNGLVKISDAIGRDL